MTLGAKIEVWQRDLIDMSRSNNLLYYRSSGRGAGITFSVDEPNRVFQRVRSAQRPLLLDELRCDLEAEELDKRLSRLRARARDDLNDRGINTLFLAFGILEWRESEHSEEIVRSPLLLVPVTLVRQGALGPFRIQRLDDEEIEVNPTLREKLLHDFKTQLPIFSDIEAPYQQSGNNGVEVSQQRAKRSLTAILDALEKMLSAVPGGCIVCEINLSRFFFQKLVMYQDLQHHRSELEKHSLLLALGGDARLREPAGLIPPDELDQQLHPKTTLEILDADSSQVEAIVAAKAGASFVLQGPPGTGKSQTIANIIAATLGQERRVLFVSEKMAALEVVRQRLHEAGLGEFCLDLHNPRADKKAFINELKAAVYKAEKPIPRADEDEWQRQSDTLQQTRKQLNQYVRELHRPRFALQRSAFYAYGRLARLHEILDRAFSIPAVEAVTPTDLERTVQAVDGLREFADIFDQYDTYPWRETLATAHTLELESTIRDRFGSLSHALKALDAGLAEIRGALGEHDEHLTFGWAKHALERLALALSSPLPPRRWLKRNEPERIRVLASEAAARSEAYWRERKQFDAKYVRSALELDHAALLQVMTEGATHALACIQDRGRPPQNTISVQRKEIDQLQRHACATLEELLPAARTLAEVCHAAIPTTIREVDALGQLADSVLAAPNPPSGWLDSGKFGMMRAVVVDAGKRYEECAHLQMPLEATYQPGYFEQDLRTYAERFQKKYQWPLRYFRLGYYRDLRRLRSVLQPGQERTAAQVEADLSQAVKLADAQAWLSEHRVKHAQALEHYFDGERTDWKQVRAALKWTGGFHAHVRLASAAPEIVQLVTGPAKALSVVRARTEQLRRLWVDWSQLASTLVESIKISSLLPGGLALEDADISELRMALQGLHAELTAIWTASDTIKSHRLPGSSDQSSAPMSNGLSGLCEDVRMAGAVRAFEVWIEEHSQVFSAEFEHFFGGLHTDWPALLATLDWTMRFLRLYPNGKVHDELARLVSSEGDAPQRERLRQVLQQAHANLAGVEKGLAFSDEVLPRSALLPPGLAQDDATIEAVGARIDSLLEKLSCLKRWLDCSQRLQQFREIGLGAFIDAMLGMHPFPQTVAQIFERRFYTLWLDRVWRESPILKQFHGETQERTIQRFRKLDVEHAKLARQRLHTLLAQQRGAAVSFARLSVDDDVSEAVIALKREVNLKRHRSIRHIVRRVAPALIELKPCWMMSPLSVSQFVETGAQLFDLVIFDEASQVCAEDAICAILRGKQLIVVGDSKQLPPTRFFTKTLADEDDEDDDKESGEERAERERVESILDECQGSGFLSRSLRWHYRSRHESLIAFSNHHFYHDDLITFPSPDARHEDGIRFVHVKDGVYDRSRSRTNRREAERVVDLVTASLREQPDLSVGVVALSEAQQRAIRDVIEGRLRSSPDLQAWQQELLEENPAGFFVKNLESVQGDERDVIILSIGYGPDASGNIYQNFGPVNRKGGERRLNVAVTRARHQLIVVASMHATDLPSELASPGARTLRAYLEYAEHGPSVLRDQSLAASSQAGARSEPEFESPFEQDVYDALVARGLNLDTQVGCSDYRIDLAVRDPQRPGKYLLGIECDGRAYHSSHTARDRDRLRQRHLEKMGWRIHRIWSSDWWNNRDGEVVRVLNALNALRGPT